MFFRLLVNSMARRMSRKLLAAFAVWVGISLILAFLAVSIDVGDKMNRELQAFGSNIRMEPVAAAVPVRGGGRDVPSLGPPSYLVGGDVWWWVGCSVAWEGKKACGRKGRRTPPGRPRHDRGCRNRIDRGAGR